MGRPAVWAIVYFLLVAGVCLLCLGYEGTQEVPQPGVAQAAASREKPRQASLQGWQAEVARRVSSFTPPRKYAAEGREKCQGHWQKQTRRRSWRSYPLSWHRNPEVYCIWPLLVSALRAISDRATQDLWNAPSGMGSGEPTAEQLAQKHANMIHKLSKLGFIGFRVYRVLGLGYALGRRAPK